MYAKCSNLTTAIVDYLAQTKEEITEGYDYQPDLTCVLQPGLSQEEKITKLWTHSEKMALAWALLSLPSKEDIIMHQNLRMCRDCHNALNLYLN